MKKWVKILLISLSTVLLIIILTLIYAIEPVDTVPYFLTDYYSASVRKIDSAVAKRSIVRDQLYAGFAEINITPKLVEGKQDPANGKFNKIKLSGFGDGKYAAGVHDSLFAKALAIKVGKDIQILVSADLLLMPPTVVNNIMTSLSKRSDLRRDQIIFGATHTHASIGNCIPGYVGNEFGGEFQMEVVQWLSSRFRELILKSINDLQFADFGSAHLFAPELIANRIIGETGRLNDRLTVLSFRQENRRTAVIGIFAAHATVIGPWNDRFSGDYPGYFQSYLENKGIDLAMFFAGTVGSHTNRGKGSKFERSKYIGQALADSAFSLLEDIQYSNDVTYSCISSGIEIPKLQAVYITEGLRLSPEVGGELFPEISGVLLQSFMLNDFVWISMPCEFSGEYAIDIQNALLLEGYESAITSFNGQYLGYVVPAKYYNYDHYESRLMGWFGPSMGDYLVELNYKLAENLIGLRL